MNKNFLEAHLSRQLGNRKQQLDFVANNKPAFPPPVVQVKETEQVVAQDIPKQEPAQQTNYIKFTKGDNLEEYRDDEQVLLEKAKLVAKCIKEAKNCIIFTGAGISTSAKLPDYRSKDKGIWVMKEKGITVDPSSSFSNSLLSEAQPTLAHKVVADLVQKGMVSHVVSTNIDGLHMKSGVPFEKLVELHGNCYLEFCEKCHAKFWRDHSVIKGVEDSQSQSHGTGNVCESCGGPLRDSIVHFGEALIPSELQRANELIQKMDCAIVLGSSMRVSPACNLPRKAVSNPQSNPNEFGKLLVVNLQKTPFEDETWIHLYGSIDKVCEEISLELGLNI
eukprot:Phypoly_transcript_12682.p1 GENE.Phypoly_transcript_12682~~Phypoly_transcript_12682.p1  ORF type:complete len:334 (+),score=62.84 Phypoly_transcript_12682:52-1053(+)